MASNCHVTAAAQYKQYLANRQCSLSMHGVCVQGQVTYRFNSNMLGMWIHHSRRCTSLDDRRNSRVSHPQQHNSVASGKMLHKHCKLASCNRTHAVSTTAPISTRHRGRYSVPQATAAAVAAAQTAADAAADAASQANATTPNVSSTAVPPVHLDPELKAKHKRPDRWVAPGPQPAAAAAAAAGSLQDPDLQPGSNETLSYLTGDWRIFQLRNGHRWSMDDMMTAYVALQTVQQPPLQRHPTAAAAAADSTGVTGLANVSHVLDLGCGIGSVLLMVAWGLRRMAMEQQQQQQQQPEDLIQQQQQQQEDFHTTSLGVEAQAISYQLAVRNVKYNLGADQQQVQVLHQDLRTPLPATVPQSFQLITGTPPYIPPGSGGQSNKPQKGPCCVEIRGGIEDYCQAAAAVLAPGGHFVVCCGLQGQPFKGQRAQRAAAAAGLVIMRQVTVVTREGKPPLFAVYVMQHAGDVSAAADAWLQQQQQQQQQEQLAQADPSSSSSSSSSSDCSVAAQVAAGQLLGSEEIFVVRHVDGKHTAAWHAAREAMGLPPLKE